MFPLFLLDDAQAGAARAGVGGLGRMYAGA
jgi:hypothetical protein